MTSNTCPTSNTCATNKCSMCSRCSMCSMNVRHTISLAALMLSAAFALTCFPFKTHAAAFQLYELGTPIIGLAGVGQAAVADDASTSFFNPAGMTQLDHSQMLIGTQIMNSQNHFETNNYNTFGGPAARKTDLLIPGAGIYYVYSYSPCLKYGISLNSPYGGSLLYGDGWAGRYFVQNNLLVNLDLNPSLALQVNDWLSVGGGFVLQYTSLNQTSAIPSAIPGVDGQSDVRVSNTAPGFNLGVLAACNQTRLGIAYRSRITQKLKGKTFFDRVNPTPTTTVSLVTPDSIIASVYQGFDNCFAVVGELGWAKWNSFKNTVVHIDDYTLVVPRKWKNTYRVGLGGEYEFMPGFMGTLGFSYDSSPTTADRRLPDLPVDRQMRYGIGLMYTTENCTRLGFQYSYIDLGYAPIHLSTRLGTLAGSYSKNSLHVLGINVNFGL